jgi:hypothetical protein
MVLVDVVRGGPLQDLAISVASSLGGPAAAAAQGAPHLLHTVLGACDGRPTRECLLCMYVPHLGLSPRTYVVNLPADGHVLG